MLTKNMKRNSLTLSQSNTGLCNIFNSNSPYNVEEKKSRKSKTKQNKRRSKKHQHITNKRINYKPKAFRKRSQSGPRLSQAKLIQIEDQEINAKKQKKTEFIANRDRNREKRNSLENTFNHNRKVKKDKKLNNLKHIKENKQYKPSKKKKLFNNIKKFETPSLDPLHSLHSLQSLQIITSSSKSTRNVINKRKNNKQANLAMTKPQSVSAITISKFKRNKRNKKLFKKRPKRARNHSIPTRNINHNLNLNKMEKPMYKYRGRGKRGKKGKKGTTIVTKRKRSKSKHLYSESEQINLNSMNEIFKTERSKSFSTTIGTSCTPTPSLKNISFEHKHKKNAKNAKNKKKKKRIKRLKKNDRKISWMYNRYREEISASPSPSPSPSPLPLSDHNHLSPRVEFIFDHNDSDYLSVSSYYSSSNVSPIIKRDKFNQCEKPNVRIVYSPRINEAVFIGYKPDGEPCYQFRGRGKVNDDDDDMSDMSDNNQIVESKTAEIRPPKFTFKHIKSKYKPHRIKWSTKTGFTDSEFDDYDDYDDIYANPIFTFSDSEHSSESESLTDSDSDIDSDHSLPGSSNSHHNDNHARAKTMKINMLLSDLLSDSDSFGDGDGDGEDNNNFTIVIDEMRQDDKGNEIYFGSVEASDDEQYTPTNENLQLRLSKTSMTQSPPSQDDLTPTDGELLFDFTSFVTHLSNKRLQLNK